MTDKQHQIVILGGGVIGLSTAVALKQEGLEVALVSNTTLTHADDRQEKKKKMPAWFRDPWVCALNEASKNWLERCGIWSLLQDEGIGCYYDVVLYDHVGGEALAFHAAELGHPALGYVVSQARMKAHLHHQMAELGIKTYVAEATAYNAQKQQLTLSNGKRLHADCFLAADGRHSWFRKALSIEQSTHDYRQKAIVATVLSEHPHQHIARQRFLPSGPLALLPLKDPYASALVYSLNEEKADEVNQYKDAAFSAHLTKQMNEPQLGQCKIVGNRHLFPLSAEHALTYQRNRVWLLGDAAHVIHPLAGQGMNLGFSDAREAVSLLKQMDTLSMDTLGRQYHRARRGDNQNMMQAMTALLWLFQQDAPVVESLRTWGMSQINTCSWIQKKLVAKALGL
jgi:2-polyprenylphenol 6-hydroxylase